MMSPFEWLCEELEARTSLKRIEARGTVRLALKQAGFSPKEVRPDELRVVLLRVLAGELKSRKVEDSEGLCEDLARELPSLEDRAQQTETAMSIFGRLGRLRG
jgi:hypothetical protein